MGLGVILPAMVLGWTAYSFAQMQAEEGPVEVARGEGLEAQLRAVVDKDAISWVVKAYALSMDTKDWELHRSIFTESYKLYRRGQFRDEHIDDRVKRLDAFTQRYAWTQHLASVYSIEIDGDEAFAVSSLHARHKGKPRENGNGATQDYLMVGRYHHWLRRTDEGWKIYQMRLIRSNG